MFEIITPSLLEIDFRQLTIVKQIICAGLPLNNSGTFWPGFELVGLLSKFNIRIFCMYKSYRFFVPRDLLKRRSSSNQRELKISQKIWS